MSGWAFRVRSTYLRGLSHGRMNNLRWLRAGIFATNAEDLSDSCSVLITKMNYIFHLRRIPTIRYVVSIVNEPLLSSSVLWQLYCVITITTTTSFVRAQVITSCSVKTNITICDIKHFFVSKVGIKASVSTAAECFNQQLIVKAQLKYNWNFSPSLFKKKTKKNE